MDQHDVVHNSLIVGTVDLGDEDESKGSTSSPSDTPSNTKISTVDKNDVTTKKEAKKPQTIYTQNIENTNKSYKAEDYSYVIVDYLSETIKSNKSSRVTGPLGTSTPRYVEQTLQIPRRDSDSGVESLETNKRQRHPHEGSLENLPAS
ncbi:hypothetical protein KUTeg_003130 [Tegillarca granosa]|uniref:Uncharacterized protein n=1 Tax=Tegillarca granosa TaxID=220873 RepID=A0ABQ9FL86_TEGGR|nr:hypothetical protein KUTeg_003130 [Tegillarca granosa]